MKKFPLLLGLFLLLTLLLTFQVQSISDDSKVYSKRRGLPLLESASPSAKPVATAEWNEELSVTERKSHWLKVSGNKGEGWVYGGNISVERLSAENSSGSPVDASSMNAAAASRGLTPMAQKYANEHDRGETAAQLKWAEQLNRGISSSDAREYLRANKLGEYSGNP